MQVTAAGFTRLLQKGLTLTVGADQTLNLTLQVGSDTQTMVVTAAPPAVQTSSSTIGATVDGTTVRQLPLNGRDWTSLATLEPRVVNVPNQATTGLSDQLANAPAGSPDANGVQTFNQNFSTTAPENYVITRFDQKLK